MKSLRRKRKSAPRKKRSFRELLRAYEDQFPRFVKRLNRTLWALILVSAAIHVVAVTFFGSWVVYRHFFHKEVLLEAAPPIQKTIDPRELKYTVHVQEQQRRSGRPNLQSRLTSQRVSGFSLPDVHSEIAPVTDPVLGSLGSFGQSGTGRGFGGGVGSGGLGLGESTVRFFGITDRGERIAFLIDISLSMAEDDKGGEAGFEKLKSEIEDMVDLLSPGTFFNLVLFGDQVDLFEQRMILATDANKRRARDFLGPYLRGIAESQARSANVLRNYEPTVEGIPAIGGSTRMDLGITAAFEQNADVVMLISDGRPRIVRRLEGKALERFEKRAAEAREANEDDAKRLAEFQKEQAEMNARRQKRGLPPKIAENRPRPPAKPSDGPPEPPGPPPWDDEDILDHIESIGKALYKDKGRPMPRINCVAFVCQRDEEEFMKRLARKFHGNFKRAKARVKPIAE